MYPAERALVLAFMAAHHPVAACVFVAGSRCRGEATPHSELDLVVIYPHLPAA